MQDSVRDAGIRTAEEMVELAQSRFVPVDTGLLRSSLAVYKSGPTVFSFGSDVRYALWVEIGSQGRPARRYLALAAETGKHHFPLFLRQELSSRGW